MAPRSETLESLDRPSHSVTALGVVAPPPIHISTPVFDGSLAMLFSCVRDHRVDLLDIPLAPVCEAYFHYLLNLPDADFDEAAAALAALAYLLERKAWLLLPQEEPEPDAYEDSYEPEPSSIGDFAMAMEVLTAWQEERAEWYFRSPDAGPGTYELPYQLANLSAADLSRAFQRVLDRAVPQDMPLLSKPRRSLNEEMQVVLDRLNGQWQSLTSVFGESATRTDCVYWFLALLELVRQGDAEVKVLDEEPVFARNQAPRAKVVLD